MIKHVIFTDQSLAKVFCYDLAGTLTLSQKRAGTLAYSAAYPHPDGGQWAVAVDMSSKDIETLCALNSLVPVYLDTTWYPSPSAPVTLL